MAETKLTVSYIVKLVVSTVLAVMGLFVLWGMTFILCFALTLNAGFSLLLGLFTSAVTIFALVAILIPPTRIRLVPSKRQKIGLYAAWIIIFGSSLPLIIINPLLFLSCLPGLVVVPLIVVYGAWRKEKEMAQK